MTEKLKLISQIACYESKISILLLQRSDRLFHQKKQRYKDQWG